MRRGAQPRFRPPPHVRPFETLQAQLLNLLGGRRLKPLGAQNPTLCGARGFRPKSRELKRSPDAADPRPALTQQFGQNGDIKNPSVPFLSGEAQARTEGRGEVGEIRQCRAAREDGRRRAAKSPNGATKTGDRSSFSSGNNEQVI